MNPAIFTPEVQAFIEGNLRADIPKILLKKPIFNTVSNQELVEQIAGKLACEKKLPTWFSTPGIYYPKKLSVEQSSSELAAEFKSKLLNGNTLLDLCGGMGVDSFYFSKRFNQVVHAEKQAELSIIASHNSNVVGCTNCRFISGDGIDFLQKHNDPFDALYIDPSRRVATQKVVKLSDCEPNVVALQALFEQKTKQVLIKTSPLLDIKLALTDLHRVQEVFVLSVGNEMKELLFFIDYEKSAISPKITCISLKENEKQTFSFTFQQEQEASAEFSAPMRYLYEPNVAWLKAGCFKLISSVYGVKKLHQHTHLYTSNELKMDFPGKIFQLKHQQSYGDFGKQTNIKQANCISRNFPLNTAELKKKHKISDGGTRFLFFVSDYKNQLQVLEAEKA